MNQMPTSNLSTRDCSKTYPIPNPTAKLFIEIGVLWPVDDTWRH